MIYYACYFDTRLIITYVSTYIDTLLIIEISWIYLYESEGGLWQAILYP